jgi:DNA-binding CsgD family transcriptional regulator
MSDNIATTRVRSLLRLQAEAYELPDLATIQRHLLAGILELIGGVGVIRLQCYDYVPGGGKDVRDGIDVGLDDDTRQRLAGVYYEDPRSDPSVVQFMDRDSELRQQGMTVVRRPDVISDRDWYNSAYVAELRRPARIDESLYLSRVVEGTRADGMGICRGWGDPRFTDDDIQLLRLFHQEVLSRFAVPGRDLAGVRLSPRERQIMAMLMRGARRKVIAAELGLSTYTVDDYIKSLYKRLGVSGLPELLARKAADPRVPS